MGTCVLSVFQQGLLMLRGLIFIYICMYIYFQLLAGASHAAE